MTNSNQRIQLYTDEEAMLAAGAEMISKKHMKAVGILAQAPVILIILFY